jgi:hypothetical protein
MGQGLAGVATDSSQQQLVTTGSNYFRMKQHLSSSDSLLQAVAAGSISQQPEAAGSSMQ